ncbi:BRO family protein [Massilia sp. TS11]|uniref:BRO-N domain-containing protein n=1 Tax=Massilia sp. TS11 TaxID=2908003 RepID=UPI001ED9D595|nr:BRO family protein [Massilia sp. TS11]MCG2586485.1 hypothetical protein [Massilia sp. TS11]
MENRSTEVAVVNGKPVAGNHAVCAGSNEASEFFFHANRVRVVIRDGEPWFICVDVAESLGYRNAPDASRHLDADEKGTQIVRTPGGDQRVTVISESGLYTLVLRSRKPEARKFAKWVTRDVLPTIRKTGCYQGEVGKMPLPLELQRAIAGDMVALSADMEYIRSWWREFGASLQVLAPEAANQVHDHIVEGAALCRIMVKRLGTNSMRAPAEQHQWRSGRRHRAASGRGIVLGQ